jgi:hypothetical protein
VSAYGSTLVVEAESTACPLTTMVWMACAVTRDRPSTDSTSSISAPSAQQPQPLLAEAIGHHDQRAVALCASASAGPVLPPVCSTTVSPGREETVALGALFTHNSAPLFGTTFVTCTSGVLPIASRIDLIARGSQRRRRQLPAVAVLGDEIDFCCGMPVGECP